MTSCPQCAVGEQLHRTVQMRVWTEKLAIHSYKLGELHGSIGMSRDTLIVTLNDNDNENTSVPASKASLQR